MPRKRGCIARPTEGSLPLRTPLLSGLRKSGDLGHTFALLVADRDHAFRCVLKGVIALKSTSDVSVGKVHFGAVIKGVVCHARERRSCGCFGREWSGLIPVFASQAASFPCNFRILVTSCL